MAAAAAATAGSALPTHHERRGSKGDLGTGMRAFRLDGGSSITSGSVYSSEGFQRRTLHSTNMHMNESFRLLLSWLEREVKSRLQVLDHKFDKLSFLVQNVQHEGRLLQVPEFEPSFTTAVPPRRFPSPIRPSKSPRSRGGGSDQCSTSSPQPILPLQARHLEVFSAAAQPPAVSPVSNGERYGDQIAQVLQQSMMKQASPKSDSVAVRMDLDNGGASPTNVGKCITSENNTDETESSYTPRTDDRSLPKSLQKSGSFKLAHQKSETLKSEGAKSEGGKSDSGQNATPRLSHTARQVWLAMEDEDNGVARWYGRVMPSICIFSVMLSLFQTPGKPPIHGIAAAIAETVVDVFFMFEICMRFLVFPNKRKFFTDELNVIDFVASFPVLIFRCAVGLTIPETGDSFDRIVLLLLVPVLRLLKAIRHLPKFPLLVMSFKLALEALPTLLYALGVLTIVFASMIYIVEPRDNIDSMPRAMWLTMVTMTTVGYGDTTPKGTPGSLITSILVISSVLFMAMPLGIIGQAFNQIWQDRDCILLARGTRARLVQWGYTADDIPVLFRAYGDGSGELSLHDFRDMMQRLAIGLSEARTLQLFHAFDDDCSGTIDAEEFTRRLFPQDYFRIYGGKGSSCFEDFT